MGFPKYEEFLEKGAVSAFDTPAAAYRFLISG
jgi:hypothetical protein